MSKLQLFQGPFVLMHSDSWFPWNTARSSVTNMSAVLKYLGGAAVTQRPDCHCGRSISFQSVMYPGRTLAFAERPADAVSGHLGNLNFYPLNAALYKGQNLILGVSFPYFLTQGLSLNPELTD